MSLKFARACWIRKGLTASLAGAYAFLTACGGGPSPKDAWEGVETAWAERSVLQLEEHMDIEAVVEDAVDGMFAYGLEEASREAEGGFGEAGTALGDMMLDAFKPQVVREGTEAIRRSFREGKLVLRGSAIWSVLGDNPAGGEWRAPLDSMVVEIESVEVADRTERRAELRLVLLHRPSGETVSLWLEAERVEDHWRITGMRNVQSFFRAADEIGRPTLSEHPQTISPEVVLVAEIGDREGAVDSKGNGEAIESTVRILKERLNDFGVRHSDIRLANGDRITIELGGLGDLDRVKKIVKQRGFLEINIVREGVEFRRTLARIDRAIVRELGPKELRPLSALLLEAGSDGIFLVREQDIPTARRYLGLDAVVEALPRNTELVWDANTVGHEGTTYRRLYVLEEEPIVTGEYLADAGPATLDPTYNGPRVPFEMTRRGARLLERGTSRHVGDQMAIVIDGRVQSAPIIRQPVSNRAQFELGQTDSLQDAQDLALVLRTGALPQPIRIVEERTAH